MIFVILGTQKFQFNRLLLTLDDCVSKGKINEEIVAQTGNSDYEPHHFKCYPFLGKDEFESYIAKADIIITHGGVGSIMTALSKEKPVIVFPRLAKYHEHVDDNQTEIASVFDAKGYVLLCRDSDDLAQCIEKAKRYTFARYVSQTGTIVNFIEDFLKS